MGAEAEALGCRGGGTWTRAKLFWVQSGLRSPSVAGTFGKSLSEWSGVRPRVEERSGSSCD